MKLILCYCDEKCHILQTVSRSLLNQSNYKIDWNLSELIYSRNLCKFDAETHYGLALQALCHRSAALHLPLVGDTTAESPERKTASKELGTDNANYWIPLLTWKTAGSSQCILLRWHHAWLPFTMNYQAMWIMLGQWMSYILTSAAFLQSLAQHSLLKTKTLWVRSMCCQMGWKLSALSGSRSNNQWFDIHLVTGNKQTTLDSGAGLTEFNTSMDNLDDNTVSKPMDDIRYHHIKAEYAVQQPNRLLFWCQVLESLESIRKGIWEL